MLRSGLARWDNKTLIYLDPPYFERGRELYYDYYRPSDHQSLADFISANMGNRHWLVSYDNVAPIKQLYGEFRNIVYSVGYSARDSRKGREVMFFSPNLEIPELIGPIQQVGGITAAA